MKVESSGGRSSQPRLLVMWRSNGVLTNIDELSKVVAMRLAIMTDIGDVSILDYQQVEILPHIIVQLCLATYN